MAKYNATINNHTTQNWSPQNLLTDNMDRFVVETASQAPFDVYVDQENFKSAEDGGYVYGTIKKYDGTRMARKPVYVELGKEKVISRKSRDQKTEFRRFTGCIVSVFRPEDDIDDIEIEPWIGPIPNQEVALISSG